MGLTNLAWLFKGPLEEFLHEVSINKILSQSWVVQAGDTAQLIYANKGPWGACTWDVSLTWNTCPYSFSCGIIFFAFK